MLKYELINFLEKIKLKEKDHKKKLKIRNWLIVCKNFIINE